MKAGESVNDYFGRTLITANKMQIYGERMEDVVIIEKILRSMTPKYDYVVCLIEELNDLDTLSIDELQSSLLWECPIRERDTKVNFVETSEEMLLMAYVDCNEAGRDHLWFLDSGCSNHMCGKRELVSQFDNNFREKVKLGNDTSLTVQGKGNVQMEINGIMQVQIGSLGEETEANITSEDELENMGSIQSDSLEGEESSNDGSPLYGGRVRRTTRVDARLCNWAGPSLMKKMLIWLS
ncbi:hypothetical protein F0562_003343 [Nyssa sinensis]|uniref:Retrovirus-related Pol polyprotein from transposon TNT 1-94-like beta-barrel domain-containing protein n=1 Tax=Nyssa sinensis TaxID=561372 RepID=A0A5J5BW96_9ASTE|nr:hypothetical protein F0562_003343 [Nyssa sinensis]